MARRRPARSRLQPARSAGMGLGFPRGHGRLDRDGHDGLRSPLRVREATGKGRPETQAVVSRLVRLFGNSARGRSGRSSGTLWCIAAHVRERCWCARHQRDSATCRPRPVSLALSRHDTTPGFFPEKSFFYWLMHCRYTHATLPLRSLRD